MSFLQGLDNTLKAMASQALGEPTMATQPGGHMVFWSTRCWWVALLSMMLTSGGFRVSLVDFVGDGVFAIVVLSFFVG